PAGIASAATVTTTSISTPPSTMPAIADDTAARSPLAAVRRTTRLLGPGVSAATSSMPVAARIPGGIRRLRCKDDAVWQPAAVQVRTMTVYYPDHEAPPPQRPAGIRPGPRPWRRARRGPRARHFALGGQSPPGRAGNLDRGAAGGALDAPVDADAAGRSACAPAAGAVPRNGRCDRSSARVRFPVFGDDRRRTLVCQPLAAAPAARAGTRTSADRAFAPGQPAPGNPVRRHRPGSAHGCRPLAGTGMRTTDG